MNLLLKKDLKIALNILELLLQIKRKYIIYENFKERRIGCKV